MKKYISQTVVIMIYLFIAACKAMIPGNGVVVGKQYEPEYAAVEMVPTPIATGVTVVQALIPYFIYDNEDWVLVVEGTQGNKVKRVKIYTTEEIFSSYQIGDPYTFNSKDRTEDKVVRRSAAEEFSNRKPIHVR
jgi:hypothetical protein